MADSKVKVDDSGNTMTGKGLLETLLAHLQGMKLKKPFDHPQTVDENEQN